MSNVHLKIDVEFEDCSEETVENVDKMMAMIKRGFVQALDESDARLRVTRRTTENGEYVKVEETAFVETEAKIQNLQREINFLQQLLLDADEVARQRGDECGLCDAMNNDSEPYPSASSAELLQTLKEQGRKPMLFLKDLEG